MNGSAFYQHLAKDLFDGSEHEDVWHKHPWMVDAYTSSTNEVRYMQMRKWLHDTFGKESWPYSDQPDWRDYYVGGATVMGWTWIGFKTEDGMQQFLNDWPNPCQPQQGPER